MKSSDQLAHELTALHLPDLTGKTVLDIGAYDGLFLLRGRTSGSGPRGSPRSFRLVGRFACPHPGLERAQRKGDIAATRRAVLSLAAKRIAGKESIRCGLFGS